MGLLDKLKPLPRWKNADPAVRLDALREVDDAATLAELAETDPDAKVRRAAVGRVDDVAVLGRIARGDADEETRDRAADRLLAVALDPSAEPLASLAAAAALEDQRRLSTVARSAPHAEVRAAALARVNDERALGGIARHASDSAIAGAALERLTQTEELVNVAVNAEHKDVALAAFERVAPVGTTDTALLTTIESRAQQKVVARRARTLLQEIEAAEAARLAAEEERRRTQAGVCEALERTAEAGGSADSLRAELARLTEAWQAVAEDGEPGARFSEAVDAVRRAIAAAERAAEEAAELGRLRAEALATREALCARVETLDGDHALEQLSAIEEEWRSLMPLVGDGPEADRLAERFAQAAAACRKRHELGAQLEETRAAFEALVTEAETLPSQEDAAAATARWQALSREARGLAASLTHAARPAPELTARLEQVGDAFTARERTVREAAERTQHEALQRLQRLVERARRAAEADTMTLREGERLMRDIHTALDHATRGSGADHAHASRELAHEVSEATTQVRELQEKVAPRVRELREMDDWRRFANAQVQEQLITQAETLVASLALADQEGREPDLAGAARNLRELHGKWREAAEAPRDKAQRLWERFRIATDLIRVRCDGYFKKLHEERATNLQRKTAIVEEAEGLATSSDWGRATARLQQLQAEWRDSGPVGRDEGRDLAHRFRTACNQFFLRRREEVSARKKIWSENLSRKEGLCERAEALAQSTDWDPAVAEMKRLQAEWRTIGPVRHAKSEQVWARFRAAADAFFERYHNRHQLALAGKLAEREALVVELEGLAASAAGAPPADDLRDRVQQLRTTWTRSVPIPSSEMHTLAERWERALSATIAAAPDAFHGTDLDPAAVRQKMEKLIARVEGLAAQAEPRAEGASQAEILAARLRSALASNAMGGRGGDDAKWRAAIDTLKDAQAAWQRLPPVVGEEGHRLERRFNEMCRRVQDAARRHSSASGKPRPSRPQAAAV